MAGRTILCIDDDTTLLELLARYFAAAGYTTHVVADSQRGVQLVSTLQPDLLILDVMMPELDGWTICEQVRATSAVPIILLTARSLEIDKLRGFHLGIDDYVTKPFSFAELVARAGAVLARTALARQTTSCVTTGELAIDFDLRRVTLAGRPVDLTPTEYRLLETLARQLHRPIATERLLHEVWGAHYAGEFEHVKRFVWTLRKKIETDPGNPRYLLTERGFGYRLD